MRNQAFQVLVYWDETEQVFIAEIPDLPGAITEGATRTEALSNAEAIIQEWISTVQTLALGGRLPETPPKS